MKFKNKVDEKEIRRPSLSCAMLGMNAFLGWEREWVIKNVT